MLSSLGGRERVLLLLPHCTFPLAGLNASSLCSRPFAPLQPRRLRGLFLATLPSQCCKNRTCNDFRMNAHGAHVTPGARTSKVQRLFRSIRKYLRRSLVLCQKTCIPIPPFPGRLAHLPVLPVKSSEETLLHLFGDDECVRRQ